MRGIDRAVLSIYLSGTNQRRVEAALRPLQKGLPVSKSAVSRLAARLREQREVWMSRDLGEEKIQYIFLDGFVVPVRRDGRVVRNPVLLAVGVRETGEKLLLLLKLAGGESTAAWRAMVEDLARRGVTRPVLCVIDGSPGLRAAEPSGRTPWWAILRAAKRGAKLSPPRTSSATQSETEDPEKLNRE